MIAFYRGSGNYAKARWGVRKVFALMIYEKYMSNTEKMTHEIKVPEQYYQPIYQSIMNDTLPSVDLFLDLREYYKLHIVDKFKQIYIKSHDYQAYLKSIELPAIMLKQYKWYMG